MTCLNLKYSEYSTKLNRGLNHLLESAHNADVTFAIEGQRIKAHQIILSMFSTYFQELFACNPCQHPIFFMKDVSYLVMKNILQFIYAGEVQIAQEDVPFFVDTANALKIKGMTDVQKSSIFPESSRRKAFENHTGNMVTSNQLDTKEKPYIVLTHGHGHEDLIETRKMNPSQIQNDIHSMNHLNGDHDRQMQVEGEPNNMLPLPQLPQNISASADSLQGLKWVTNELDDTSLEIAQPQIQYPVHLGAMVSNNADQRCKMLKHDHETTNTAAVDPNNYAASLRICSTMEAMTNELREIRRTREDILGRLDRIEMRMSTEHQNERTAEPQFNQRVSSFQLPIKNIMEFEDANKELENDVIRGLLALELRVVGGNNERHNIRAIIRKLLSKEVALLFSSRGKKGKRDFSATNFYKVVTDPPVSLVEAVRLRFMEITDTEILQFVGFTLATAGDWNGGAKIRTGNKISATSTLPPDLNVKMESFDSLEDIGNLN